MNRQRLVCLLLALITLLVYLPVRRYGFVLFDDSDYVTDNRVVQAGLTWAGLKWAFTTWHASNWHPLTWLSHMLDCQLFGLDAGAHHLVNVLFHIANTVLLFLLWNRMTKTLWPSAFVAALFAWHPLHVESVAWVAERKDTLSTAFGLLALLAYNRYVQRSGVRKPTSDLRPPASASHWLAVLCFALSLMAKPMMVTLPFLLLLLDYWPLKRMSGAGARVSGSPQSSTLNSQGSTIWRLALEKWPFFLLAAVSCGVTVLAQRKEAVIALDQHPFGLRSANALVAYARYLFKMIWPADLAVFYPLPGRIPGWQVAAAAAGLGAISLLAWQSRRRSPYVLMGWLWFLGTLVPVIGLVQVGGQAMADRYTYIPLVGVFVAVAFGVRDLASRLHWPVAVISVAVGLVLGASLIATAHQLPYWQDSESLFTRALAVTRNNAIMHINLGMALEQNGQREEALAHYREAKRIDPRRAEAHNNLANLLDDSGNSSEALAEYREALRLKPDAPLAHLNLGTLLVKLGQFDDAMRHYAEAARLRSDDPRPHYLMGKACLRQGQSAEAIAHFHDALQLDPNDLQTLIFLARVLASDENPRVRNGAEAVARAEQANMLTDGEQPFVLDTLAMAYAETARFADAQQTAEKAIQLATAAGDKDAIPAMQQRQRLYQSSQPYRETAADASPHTP